MTKNQKMFAGIDALVAAGEGASKEVKRGISYILEKKQEDDAITYPTGIGLPNQFYIYYHSYNKIFPLLALSHYISDRKTR